MAPSGWMFHKKDWWLEEHGKIMEKPDFPVPSGKYVVTGGRETQAILTVHDNGDDWELSDGACLHDVTHLPCRSARYIPINDSGSRTLPRWRSSLSLQEGRCPRWRDAANKTTGWSLYSHWRTNEENYQLISYM